MIGGIVACILVSAAAPSGESLFQTACEAYQNEEFGRAAALFERLAADGVVSAPLFANLGHTYTAMDRPGWAIANFERSLVLNPQYSPAMEGLAAATEAAGGDRAKPALPMWRRAAAGVRLGMAPASYRWCYGGLWIMFWLLLAYGTVRPRTPAITACTVAAAIMAVASLGLWDMFRPYPYAVAALDSIPVRYTTNESQPARFELHEGDWVRIETVRDDWARVAIQSGDRGWAKRDALAPVGPPFVGAPGDLTGEAH